MNGMLKNFPQLGTSLNISIQNQVLDKLVLKASIAIFKSHKFIPATVTTNLL